MGAAARLALVGLLVARLASSVLAADAPTLLREGSPNAADVRLVDASGTSAPILVDAADAEVVRIAAGLFADDVGAVTGHPSKVVTSVDASASDVVIAGTIGASPTIDRLIADGKLDVANVRGQWETFAIAVVDRPLPNVERGLVIAGSDRRGTAYGLLELSEQIGVSPWCWWADSKPAHRDALTIAAGRTVVGPPTVKYRGIFLNDEDWGLQPWAARTFEPEVGNIGPKTYRRIFELLLRLKANYLWPAMHPISTEFGRIPENVKLADDWAIVMGASHAEPMNRNNVRWRRENRGDWRYDTNRDGVLAYWREWATFRGPYEAVWTLGMRGIHDSGMEGPKDVAAKVELLGKAIEDQRKLLAEHVNPHVEQVPQAFMPYKEVLALYQAGLKVPDDVTLVWCDDNYGYLRQLSTPAEQKRAGGSGVYYHISYLGAPKSYLWVDSTPPTQVYEQMRTALDYGANRIWVLNVGDLKSMERGTEFWLRLAWNAKRFGSDPQTQFLTEWATREFGAANSDAIAAVLNAYYCLNAQRKPELMEAGAFSVANYDEAIGRLYAFESVLETVDALAAKIDARQRDAFFELVAYTVRVAALTNVAFLANDLAAARKADRPDEAAMYVAKVRDAGRRLVRETHDYNETLAGGKWRGIMTLGGYEPTGEYTKWPASGFMAIPGVTTQPTTLPAGASDSHTVFFSVATPLPAVAPPTAFAERGGVVSIEAEHFSRDRAAGEARWTVVPWLGRSGPGAVAVMPTTIASTVDVAAAPALEYDFTSISTPASVSVRAYCAPTYHLHAGRGLRYAIAIDDFALQIVDLAGDGDASPDGGRAARKRLRRNVAIGSSTHAIGPAGRHVLRVWMVDPGVILDKFVIDLGGLKPSELGPPETPAASSGGD